MTVEAIPLVGFRSWYVNWRPPSLLHSMGRYEPRWPPGERVRAYCFHAKYRTPKTSCGTCDAPQWDCSCGLYAWYSLDDVYEPQDFFVDSDWYDQAMWGGRAAGAIAASGRVIECERGFRAEYAEPVALLEFEIASDDRNWLRELADTYQVPVLPRRELVEYARWRGELGIPVCRDG